MMASMLCSPLILVAARRSSHRPETPEGGRKDRVVPSELFGEMLHGPWPRQRFIHATWPLGSVSSHLPRRAGHATALSGEQYVPATTCILFAKH